MTQDFSKAMPRPWDHVNGNLYDANDDWVASVGADNAPLIVEAVNSFDTNRKALDAQDALIAELMEALEPFSIPPWYGDIDSAAPDNGPIITYYAPNDQGDGHSITRGDFRRARAALAKAREVTG